MLGPGKVGMQDLKYCNYLALLIVTFISNPNIHSVFIRGAKRFLKFQKFTPYQQSGYYANKLPEVLVGYIMSRYFIVSSFWF